MANTGRPSRLLNLQKSPTSNKAIAAKNVATSPFLKLPPEIRQRIYGYALGGRILHVASGPILGRNSVVVCVNCDDFTDALDWKMIHGIRFCRGIIEEKNRGVTHSQLESHKQCYQAHATLSLNLIGTCRQIYHEAVLVPFKKNAFAVVDDITPIRARPILANFLNRLVPTQAKAIAHLILQGRRIYGNRRPTLARLKGLEFLEFVLVLEGRWYRPHDSRPEYWEENFTDQKLGKLGLPPLCDVRIKVREYVGRNQGDPPGPGLMEWVQSLERRVRA